MCLRTPVETYMRATEVAFKVGDFPNQHTRPKDAISAYYFFIRVRVSVRPSAIIPSSSVQHIVKWEPM